MQIPAGWPLTWRIFCPTRTTFSLLFFLVCFSSCGSNLRSLMKVQWPPTGGSIGLGGSVIEFWWIVFVTAATGAKTMDKVIRIKLWRKFWRLKPPLQVLSHFSAVCVYVFLRRDCVVLIPCNLIQEQRLHNPDLTDFNWFNLRAGMRWIPSDPVCTWLIRTEPARHQSDRPLALSLCSL